MSLHVTSPEVSRLVCLSSSISHRMSSVGSCLSSLFTTLDCSSPRCDARGAAVQAERQRGSRRQRCGEKSVTQGQMVTQLNCEVHIWGCADADWFCHRSFIHDVIDGWVGLHVPFRYTTEASLRVAAYTP